jgi:LysR family nitrogen assimilation transcriptional regulator
MDLKQLTAFVAVYEEGSINRAARRLSLSQPSTSALIRGLERVLGVTLFERLSSGVEPTEAAATLYRHAQRVMAELDAARKGVTGALDVISGPIKVGLSPTITRGILPELLPDFLERHPSVDIQITEAFSGKLFDWTVDGELDFAVVNIPVNDRRLTTRRIAAEPVVLICGPKSGRRHMQGTRLSEGPPLKLALPWSPISLRQLLDRFIHAGSVPVARMVEMDSLPALLDFVAASDWVTLLPATCTTRDLSGKHQIVQPVIEPEMPTEFYLVHPARRTLSAAAKAFADAIESGFERSQERWRGAVRRSRHVVSI